MRIMKSKATDPTYHVIQDVKRDGKRSTEIIENLGHASDISEIEDTPENRNRIFYKQMLVEGYDEERDIAFDQTLIVTYSLKYKLYQQTIRERQIERAKKYLQHPAQYDKHSVTDAKRFIKKTPVTNDGEIAEKAAYELNINAIEEEAKYDGFYAVCTNLDDDPAEIARINHDRWEIEESFRIMKSEFDARPVYLHRDDRIKAHFLTCFISLMIYSIFHEKCIKAANAVTVCICGDF